MTKFKKGDRVCRTGNFTILPAGDYTVRAVRENGTIVLEEPTDFPFHNAKFFELVRRPDPIEEAKAVLAAAGYGITEPKKPETGQAVIYKMDEHVYATTKESWDNWVRVGTTGRCVLIAIVDWTEGEGI